MANKIQWNPVLECDLDDGTHTCYATEYKNGRFIWLSQLADDTWDIETNTHRGGDLYTIVNCKTLTSAKRYAARYLL